MIQQGYRNLESQYLRGGQEIQRTNTNKVIKGIKGERYPQCPLNMKENYMNEWKKVSEIRCSLPYDIYGPNVLATMPYDLSDIHMQSTVRN